MASNNYQPYHQLQRQMLAKRKLSTHITEILSAWLAIVLLTTSICGVGYLFYLLFLKELTQLP